MKQLKRLVAGSVLGLALLAGAPVTAQEQVDEQPVHEGKLVLVWCISCNEHHLVMI